MNPPVFAPHMTGTCTCGGRIIITGRDGAVRKLWFYIYRMILGRKLGRSDIDVLVYVATKAFLVYHTVV